MTVVIETGSVGGVMDKRQMVANMRAYAKDPTPKNREAMVMSQREYESAVTADRRERDAAAYRRDMDDARIRVLRTLREIKPSGPATGWPVVGTCSRRHAEWVGMAASVAGGAIYISSGEIPGVTDDDRFLAVGGCGVQSVLPALDVVAAIRAELRRLAESAAPDSAAELLDSYRHLCGCLVAKE